MLSPSRALSFDALDRQATKNQQAGAREGAGAASGVVGEPGTTAAQVVVLPSYAGGVTVYPFSPFASEFHPNPFFPHGILNNQLSNSVLPISRGSFVPSVKTRRTTRRTRRGLSLAALFACFPAGMRA
jgi:hypothetical protein